MYMSFTSRRFFGQLLLHTFTVDTATQMEIQEARALWGGTSMSEAGKRAATETFARPTAQSTFCVMDVSYFCLLLSVSNFLR